MITRLCRPDWIFTRWSRPWQVIKCVTRASSGRRSLWMQIADPPAFTLSGTQESKSRSQHLDSLKKLVLSMHFLETNDVAVVQESFQKIEFELSVLPLRENRSNETPGVPSNWKSASTRQAAKQWGGEGAAITHEAVLAWERTRCNTSGEIPETDKSDETRVNNSPLPKEACLNTGFPIPFLRSLMLRTCARVSSAETMNAPSSSPSGKRILSWSANSTTKAQIAFRSPGLQVIWIDAPWKLFCRSRRDC